MDLTVFGATGGTGGEVVRQALDAGHRVTAVVRDPARLKLEHPALRVVTAGVTDPGTLVPALEGRDAAISGIGARSRRPGGIAAASARGILPALETCGVRRFLAVSAMPLGPVPEGEGVFYRAVAVPLLRRILRDVYADLAEMEREIRQSSADWTVVRPPKLTNGPVTGEYRRAVGANVLRGHSISRADVAHAMLAMVEDPAVVKQPVGVAY